MSWYTCIIKHAGVQLWTKVIYTYLFEHFHNSDLISFYHTTVMHVLCFDGTGSVNGPLMDFSRDSFSTLRGVFSRWQKYSALHSCHDFNNPWPKLAWNNVLLLCLRFNLSSMCEVSRMYIMTFLVVEGNVIWLTCKAVSLGLCLVDICVLANAEGSYNGHETVVGLQHWLFSDSSILFSETYECKGVNNIHSSNHNSTQ
jgi:hypothetical protein